MACGGGGDAPFLLASKGESEDDNVDKDKKGHILRLTCTSRSKGSNRSHNVRLSMDVRAWGADGVICREEQNSPAVRWKRGVGQPGVQRVVVG